MTMKTLKEVAEYFNVHPRTITRWIERYDMPHIRIGGAQGTTRFNMKDVMEWAARKTEEEEDDGEKG